MRKVRKQRIRGARVDRRKEAIMFGGDKRNQKK